MYKKAALIATFFLLGAVRGTAEETPISLLLGEIRDQNVHIRTGPTTNCEDVAKAAQGDLLLVRDERFGWIQVDLPLWAVAWIHEDLVRLDQEEQPQEEDFLEPTLEELLCFGVVTGDRVNLRSRPGLRHTTLGQCRSGTRVRCTGRYGEWIRIQAPPGQTGWIHGDLIQIRPLHMSSLELEKALSEKGALLVCGRCEENGVLHHSIVGPFATLRNESLGAKFLGQKVLVAAHVALGDLPDRHPLLDVLAVQVVPSPQDEKP